MSRYFLGLMLFLGLVSASVHAEEGVLLKDETLRASASGSASAVGAAAKGSAVDILRREGGWMQIKAGEKTGWVRLLSVRKGTAATRNVGAELGGVLGIGLNKSDSSRVVATAGMRGLSEEDLKAAKFDQNELDKLNGLAVSKKDAEKFARKGGLVAQNVEYLPAPAGSKPAASNANAGGSFNLMGGE